jgi:hypothetical protein
MHLTVYLAAILAAASLSRPSGGAIIDATWILNGDGNWNTAGNWDIGVVPNNNAIDQYNVRIDNDLNFDVVVSLNLALDVDNLTVDVGDELSFPNNIDLEIAGPLALISLAGCELALVLQQRRKDVRKLFDEAHLQR